ncbi:protease pro-enzyme activation domain-containing protein, partial [Dyella sp. EPa41]|uniref:protease pro-enzyme activation domain-containing protein n=1 Tax=Dyella sp. EPa41 TaxID=1561194 RepID=UPI001915450A
TKAQLATDAGAMPSNSPMRNMTLVLKRSAEKQGRFDAYVKQLNNPSSPYFHKWLNAKQIGAMFGPAQSDIDQVTNWLTSQGLKVDRVLPSGMMIRFSGTSANVGRAFHTQIHSYKLNGETHFANTTEQQIPQALASVVLGVASLDNFFPHPQYRNVGVVNKDKRTGQWKRVSTSPDFTVPPGTIDTNAAYDVVPADFNTIYNVTPLWNQASPVRGAGQTVAVLERTDVQPSDIATFRQAFLPANAKGVVSFVNPVTGAGDTSCADPGINGDEGEAALDAEWAGAAAPDANVMFASCDDSNSPNFGPFTAAVNLLNNFDLPPPSIFSLSYGECEVMSMTNVVSEVGVIWEQAAAEGVTVFVSSGDAGSAGCDQNQAAAVFGMNVNAMASTPFNVAVGGTDFDDLHQSGKYWTSSNLAYGQSAISYIPEQTWNTSCASSKLDAVLKLSDGVAACNDPVNGQNFLNTGGGSGGPSTLWLQPAWQAGIYGSPGTQMRMLPDVSLFAANGLYGHALVFCMSDANVGGTACDYTNPDNVFFNSAGGTSFAAPAMAGVQALVNEATNQAHGNVAPALYTLATHEYGTSASPNTAMINACNSSNGTSIGANCVFNDVTQGDIDEPCYAGTTSCYSGNGKNAYGVLSHGGDVVLAPAWKTSAGYDYATGLGSINVTNLVNAMAAYDRPHLRGYASPGDFLNPVGAGVDGYSDIAAVDPVRGIFTDIAMQGSTTIQVQTQAISPGYTIGAIGAFYQHIDDAGGTLLQALLPGLNYASLAWTGPDNELYVWLSDGYGGKGNYLAKAMSSIDPGWTLVGTGDFDGVGKDELLFRNNATGQIAWWQLDLTATFRLGAIQRHFAVSPPVSLAAATGYVPTIADVDGDGYADIVWTSPSDNSVYVWINNHAGDFVRRRVADHPAGFTLFGAGDLGGDGKTELIWTNPTASQMSWWVMNGFTVVDQEVRSVTPGYTMASLGDYDGDGLADILWVGQAGDVYEWQGRGNGFQSLRVTDSNGNPLVIPAGSKVQALRLQGAATAGYDLPQSP